jgi:alkylated DNA repair dioxygenase AlkB
VPNQFDLFKQEAEPQGFALDSDFITSDEEDDLIEEIGGLPMKPFQFGAFEGKRRVASFGWHYDYSEQQLQESSPAPAWLTPFAHRIERSFRLTNGAIQHILCTEYDAGVGIGWHRDKPHFDLVFGLSLASTCKFRFRRKVGAAWTRLNFEVAPRSLYKMSGESRHVWEHSIPAVASRRYSITFRTMAARKSTRSLATAHQL